MVKLQVMDELGSDPRLSCDSYITFYCIYFLSNVTKYQLIYFSHRQSLSLHFNHTKSRRHRQKDKQVKNKRKEEECLPNGQKKKNKQQELEWTKIIPMIANLQFCILSEEMNSAWPLVPCKQLEFSPTAAPRLLHSKFRSGRSAGGQETGGFIWEN